MYESRNNNNKNNNEKGTFFSMHTYKRKEKSLTYHYKFILLLLAYCVTISEPITLSVQSNKSLGM